MRIGITGRAGAGKSTFAKYLQAAITSHGLSCSIVSTSDALKHAVSILFDWPLEDLQGEQNRQWRETPDPYWSQRLGKDIVPRNMLQWLGTDVFRDKLHKDFWLHRLERNCANADVVILESARFDNELKWCDVTIRITSNREMKLAHSSEKCTYDCQFTVTNNGSYSSLICDARTIASRIIENTFAHNTGRYTRSH